jgi:hypothetical protein
MPRSAEMFNIDQFLKSTKGYELKSRIKNVLGKVEVKQRKTGRCEECYDCAFTSTKQCPNLLNVFRLQWSENDYLESSSVNDEVEFMHSLHTQEDVESLEMALNMFELNEKLVFKMSHFI